MIADGIPLEEQIAALLAVCDDAMGRGGVPTLTFGAELPAELRLRLQRTLNTIRRLHRHFPRPSTMPCVPTGTGQSEPLSIEPPFTRLGRFLIRRELGRGAHGLVFLAYDPGLCREVALKVAHGDALVAPVQRERFLREARAAAALDHPNLVPIYEAGEVGPVCYIASAYCPGGTLADWLRHHGAMRERGAADLVATLADAMQYAHERGIVHRDLKPSNILLQEPHKPGTGLPWVPRIGDFGTAMATVVGATAPVGGGIVGTPCYMAPEQAGGTATVGPAADIHALGAILYELLTGRPPFEAGAVFTVLEQVKTQVPLAPSQRQPSLSSALDTICLTCLHKDPDRRYANAGELARALRDLPSARQPGSAAGRVGRVTLRGLVLGCIALAALLVPALRGWLPDDAPAAPHAEQPAPLAFPLTLRGHAAPVYDVAFSPDGRTLAAAGLKCLKLWDLTTGTERPALPHSDAPFTSVAFSPDGQRLVGGGMYSMSRVWDLTTGELHTERTWIHGEARCLSFHPDGAQVASACIFWCGPGFHTPMGDLRIWRPVHGQDLRVLQDGLEEGVLAVAYSHDGRRLVSGTGNFDKKLRRVTAGALTMWDPESGTALYTRRNPNGGYFDTAFHPDGSTFACACTDHSITLHDTATGDVVRTLSGHTDATWTVTFSPDGRRLASAGADRVIHIWDVAGGELLETLDGYSTTVHRVRYNHDGTRLASGTTDGLVKVWDMTAGARSAR